MATPSSPIGYPESSPSASLYEDATQSCAGKSWIDSDFREGVGGGHFSGVQRTTRTRAGSLSSSGFSSSHGRSQHPSQKPKHNPVRTKPARYIHRGSTNDEAMNEISKQLEANMEAYTEIQAQEALDLAHASMRVLHAEEIYTIERLGEGRVHMRALENKVVEVKNRLRLAGLQVVYLKEKLVANGFFLSDSPVRDASERLQRKSMPYASLTPSELARISALPPGLNASPPATPDLLRERITRVDVPSWTQTTRPGAPPSDVPEDDDASALEGGDAGSPLGESEVNPSEVMGAAP